MAPLHRAAATAASEQVQVGQMIQHFTHPHPLQQVHLSQEFNCNGCNITGLGVRYHCPTCDFHLHQQCAQSPFNLLSPHLHPHHQLTLVNRPGKSHFCDLCGAIADGMFYTCQTCDVDIHPLCSQLPLNVHHAFHPQHPLTLQPGHPSSCCSVCRQGCGTWRYKCNVCDHVDVHLNCLVTVPSPQGQGGHLPTWVPPKAVGYMGGGGDQPITHAVGYLGVNYGVNQSPTNYQMTHTVGYSGGNHGVNQPINTNYQMGQVVGYHGGSEGNYGNNQVPITYQTQGSGNGRKNTGIQFASKLGKFAANVAVTSIIGVPLNFSSTKK